jgi:hypothetical protein
VFVKPVETLNALLMLMLAFLIVVVRVMPSDFESASSEGDGEQPPSDKNGEYQG